MSGGGLFDLLESFFGSKIDEGIDQAKQNGKSKAKGIIMGALNGIETLAQESGVVRSGLSGALRGMADHIESQQLEEAPSNDDIIEVEAVIEKKKEESFDIPLEDDEEE